MIMNILEDYLSKKSDNKLGWLFIKVDGSNKLLNLSENPCYFLCLLKESNQRKGTQLKLMKLVKINFTRTRKYIRSTHYFLSQITSELTFY